ncbi:porin family protein [Stenotrophomonas sp. MMGLT7]|uniref:porin family protein n=1 Tax=Stenotrophomonas sp. MMGLT7 TaxID=2901227 RepID=UPI001E4E5469|nr:porin family protein [Stenotrophomonas sp. MMGLT7]MCD7097816.1 porin family protein [Stenotrophomonas sp. MMGLT7]
MRKPALVLIVSALGLTAATQLHAQDAGSAGWFVNGSAGRTSIKEGPYDGRDTGYSVNGGYRWGLFPWLSLGLEVGYNDLGNIEARNLFDGDQVIDDGKSQLHGWTAGVNQRFDFGPKWYASVRGGVYGWKGRGLSNDEVSRRQDLDKLSWYAGVGAGYDFTDHLSAGVNYDYYAAKKFDVDLSTDMASLSVEYRF